MENEENNVVTLFNEDGSEIHFQFLDMINYEYKEYVILLAIDDEEDNSIYIFNVEHTGEEMDDYIPVEDDRIGDAVYKLFKERNKGVFEFDD